MEPEFTSLDLVRTRSPLRILAVVLCLIVSLSVAALAWVPWQQSVVGRGAVTMFSPTERPQAIEAPIPGRLARWHVKEGDTVRKGQLICVLDDLEARFLDPAQPRILAGQLARVRVRRQAVVERLASLEEQQRSVQRSREAAIAAAGQKVRQAQAREEMAAQAVRAVSQAVEASSINYRRVAQLHAGGLRSKRDLELAELERVRAETEVERARAAVTVARQEIEGARADRSKVEADTAASLASLEASQHQARESRASIEADLLKLEADLRNLERRVVQRKVLAPCEGSVTRITKAGAGETVKVGEDLCVLVPQSRDVAVELWVSGFDTPLLAPGRTVRLIFDGFPAVPFTAWPWASVGTFAGRIKVIDPVDDGSGKYRVLVVPDLTQPDGTWPPATRLRPGARTVGWVMLDNVPLYKEAWRRVNAFPPTVDLSAQKEGKGGSSYGSDSDKGSDKGGDKAAVKAKPVLKR